MYVCMYVEEQTQEIKRRWVRVTVGGIERCGLQQQKNVSAFPRWFISQVVWSGQVGANLVRLVCYVGPRSDI